ncbi:MAG: radical SAM protein [Clostridia bacterium]|nr:radical SAM protein [Clostridia bacterium]
MYSKVYVEITNICNMSCSFCHGHKRESRRMNKDEFSFILSALTDKTKYIYYHLMGEPLTHPQLHEFIKMAGERGFRSVVTTNGTLLRKRGEELLSSGLYKVNISVHSFEKESDEEHAKYIRELAEFSEKAAEEGTIVVFRLWNNGFDGGRNDVTFNLLKELIQGEWAENTRGIRIRDKIHIEWGERFEWPDTEAEIKGERFFCYGLKDHFGILSDGTVVPCCLDSDGVINLGNIFSEDIDTILDSERARAITEGFAKGEASEELCKRCGYAQRFVK